MAQYLVTSQTEPPHIKLGHGSVFMATASKLSLKDSKMYPSVVKATNRRGSIPAPISFMLGILSTQSHLLCFDGLPDDILLITFSQLAAAPS